MASSITVNPDLKKSIRSLRLSGNPAKHKTKTQSAIVVQISESREAVQEDTWEGEDVSDLVDELPENKPRFIVLSYELTYPDGRVKYPFVLLDWQPENTSPQQATIYASALQFFSKEVEIDRVIPLREGEITKQIIDDALLKT